MGELDTGYGGVCLDFRPVPAIIHGGGGERELVYVRSDETRPVSEGALRGFGG